MGGCTKTVSSSRSILTGIAARRLTTALSLVEQAAMLGHTAAQFLAEPELDALKTEPRYIAVMSAKGPGR